MPALAPGERARCTRCDGILARAGGGRAAVGCTAAAALGAFFLYWPAVLLPILEVRQLGQHYQSSLLRGTLELISRGNLLVGGVVLLCSIIFPLLKIVLLIELSLLSLLHQRHQAFTYRAMEHLGKWSMMDVMLLALLVMLVKLGNLVTFHFGPAAIAFVLCVALSMLASISFDSHAIWEDDDEPNTGE